MGRERLWAGCIPHLGASVACSQQDASGGSWSERARQRHRVRAARWGALMCLMWGCVTAGIAAWAIKFNVQKPGASHLRPIYIWPGGHTRAARVDGKLRSGQMHSQMQNFRNSPHMHAGTTLINDIVQGYSEHTPCNGGVAHAHEGRWPRDQKYEQTRHGC